MTFTAFLIGILISLASIGYISWIMWKEKKDEETSATAPEATPADPAKNSVTTDELLGRLGLDNKATPKPTASPGKKQGTGLAAIFQRFQKSPAPPKAPSSPITAAGRGEKKEFKFPLNITALKAMFQKQPTAIETGTVSLRLDPVSPLAQAPATVETPPASNDAPASSDISEESALALEKDELQTKYQDLLEKYQKLDQLFQEKSQDLEKSEKALTNELKNRKEFNKIKDLLEKELKENKDKGRDLQIASTTAQTEAESFLKRINQLEEKVTKTEKEVLKKEDELKAAEVKILAEKSRGSDWEEKLKKTEALLAEKNHKITELVKHIEDQTHQTVPKSVPTEPLSAPVVPQPEIQIIEPPPAPPEPPAVEITKPTPPSTSEPTTPVPDKEPEAIPEPIPLPSEETSSTAPETPANGANTLTQDIPAVTDVEPPATPAPSLLPDILQEPPQAPEQMPQTPPSAGPTENTDETKDTSPSNPPNPPNPD